MKIYAPDYFKDFKCIADKCKKSCCVGWDIYIDDRTLEKYSHLDGELGEFINCNTELDEDGCRFVMKEGKRCPFLANSGLCDLICKLGEGYLCDICREHPRFYNWYCHKTEAGLGLCCEEAARIILSQTGKTVIEYYTEDDSRSYPTYPEELELIEYRDRILDMLQDREFTVEKRIDNVSESFILYSKTDYLRRFSPKKWSEILFSLERLDTDWEKYLSVLAEHGKYAPLPELAIPFEKLLVYFVYRHASSLCSILEVEDYCRFAFTSFMIINSICNGVKEKYGEIDFETFVDICRSFSSEIEYSDENMNYYNAK